MTDRSHGGYDRGRRPPVYGTARDANSYRPASRLGQSGYGASNAQEYSSQQYGAPPDYDEPQDYFTPQADAYYQPPPPAGPSRGQKLINIAGALGSVALVLSLGWWGWELAVRDARGVPVIRAMEGAMRVAPVDPGGSVMDHQGLSVNDVPAQGGAAPPAQRLVLAPKPVDLLEEDGAGLAANLAPLAPSSPPPAQVETLAPEIAQPDPIEVPATEDSTPPIPTVVDTDEAVAAALAEALGTDISEILETAVLDEAGQPPPEGAITRSPRPLARPAGGATASASAQAAAAQIAPPVAVDPATLAPGTRLVQFGAYESPELAQNQWSQIAAKFPALMAGKEMVIQAAESGGHTFWRLRAKGFDNEGDSRRFCAALEAEGTKCIPVAHR